MNRLTTAFIAGALGSLTTNLLHEIARRAFPDAPRLDVLGMQALAKGAAALDAPPPVGKRLYLTTLAGDLASNTGYYALVGLASREYSVAAGVALGIAAGIGAVALPPRMGLSAKPTSRTAVTKALTVTLYGAGGAAAGFAQRGLRA